MRKWIIKEIEESLKRRKGESYCTNIIRVINTSYCVHTGTKYIHVILYQVQSIVDKAVSNCLFENLDLFLS